MLTGKMPFGDQLEKLTDQRKLNSLTYVSALKYNPMVPYWLDGALQKALSPLPEKRHEAFSEFIYELKTPNKKYSSKTSSPLIQRNPLVVWQGLALIEGVTILILLKYFLA
jgi:protein phosphatase